MTKLSYTVGAIRDAGIECRWSRTRNGAPIIIGKTDTVSRDGNHMWAVIDAGMWKRAEVVGIARAFKEHTALIGFFSVPA